MACRQLQPISENTLNGSRMGSAPSRAVTQPSSLHSLPHPHLPDPEVGFLVSPSLPIAPLPQLPATHFPHTPQGLLPARPWHTLHPLPLPLCLQHSRLGRTAPSSRKLFPLPHVALC